MSEFAAILTAGIMTVRGGPSPHGLRSFLRERTSESHRHLDASFASFGDAPMARDYHRFIRMNLVAHRALAAFLSGSSSSVTDELAASIDADLARLESDAVSMDLDCPARATFHLGTFEAPEAAGIGYVLDGSKLGAKFIHRKLGKASLLRPEGSLTASFLAAAFLRPGAIGQTPADLSEDNSTRERAASAALATFALFARSIDLAAAVRGEEQPSQ